MPGWRVDFMENVLMILGKVKAEDEKAAKLFNIPSARQNKIVITRLDSPHGGDKWLTCSARRDPPRG